MKYSIIYFFIFFLSAMHLKSISQNAGTIDTSFNIGFNATSSVETISIQTDKKIILGGPFTNFSGVNYNRLVRLFENGAIDTSYHIGSAANGNIRCSALQTNGKLIIGGFFSIFNGTNTNRIARLNEDGSIDTSFHIGSGLNGGPWVMKIQSDGKIIVGGNFTNYNGFDTRNIVRLNSDGSIDSTFVIGNGFNSNVYAICIQPDGKIILGGDFTLYNGVIANNLIRLNNNGSIDSSFNIGTGANLRVSSLAIQNDGKIIIGGGFSIFNGINVSTIMRLNSNGSIDTSFNTGSGIDHEVGTILIEPDGKIIFGGDFTVYNGVSQNYLARVYEDGTLDSSFAIGVGPNDGTWTCVLQDDGKILVGGIFSTFNNNNYSGIIRLFIGKENILTPLVSKSESEIIVYPNPTENNIFILGANNGHIKIYNALGNLIQEERNLISPELDINCLPAGIYFIEIQVDSSLTKLKFVISK